MLDNDNAPVSPLQLPAVQHLANARRVLEIACEGHPFMDEEGRAAIPDAKRVAWATIANVAEGPTVTLNAAAGDPDLDDDGTAEDNDPAERNDEPDDPAGDAELICDSPGFDTADRRVARVHGQSAGCILSDPDVEHNGDEPENWSHRDDHPAELCIGQRPGHTDSPPEAA